ncbi:hypothetical protein OG976_20285 [Mycobacterium sp. NBC_00419]|uniref:hypothetical protein n=1 Tax=Mycobacterium sp. NBC_00419 TaxID=2975989 RepID=UPI002E1F7E68
MMHAMRAEAWQVINRTSPVVLVTGDSGTGKSSVLRSTIAEYSDAVVAPPVAVCLFDSGALQSAIMDVLADAIAIAQPGQSKWGALAKQLRYATSEAAVEIGKGLAEALVSEVFELAKAKLGENVGKGLAKFIKSLKKDKSGELRRTLRAHSDANIVRMLVKIADEVATSIGRDIVITLDEGNRLADDDQRILASVAANPAKRARIVVAWSTAEAESIAGLTRLRRLGVAEVEVSGLSRGDIRRWLATEGHADQSDEVYALTAGFPLLVEGLITHLRSGGRIDRYSAPTLFNEVLSDALSRLPQDAHHAARKLCAFPAPLPDYDIPAYLDVDVTGWGVIREALERERVFSVESTDGTWFHEARRKYLWDNVLTTAERNAIGQAAYTKLVAEHRRQQEVGLFGMYRQIAFLAAYAVDSQAANPALASIIAMDTDQLAVLAAVIELENVGLGSPTPADQVVIHAHSAFGADRHRALKALPALVGLGFVELDEVPRADIDRSESTVELCLDDEARVVALGQIQSVLAQPAVPNLVNHVVRTHMESVRLESYMVVSQAGQADVLDIIAKANLFRAPAALMRVGDPLLGVWLRYGQQPVTVVAVFNNAGDRMRAEQEIANLKGSSFGRKLLVQGLFHDPTHTIASLRFLRAAEFATGLQVGTDGQRYSLRNSAPLTMAEFAQRQVDLLGLLQVHTNELERGVYGLTRPRGIAIARGDQTEHKIEVFGAAHVYPMVFDQIEHILASGSLISAQVELALDLSPECTTRFFTTQRWQGDRTHDPVIEALSGLRIHAERFNTRQPRTQVHLQRHRLRAELKAAHIRDQQLARQMAENITIGGRRGPRPQRALRLAIYGRGPTHRLEQRGAVCAWPIGDPEDVQIEFISGEPAQTAEALYARAFGTDADATDLYAGRLSAVLAYLLGFAENEIEVRE